MNTKTVFTTIEYEAIHCWLDAPEEVFYLRNKHRHLFKACIHVYVTHDNRDVEFIMLKHRVREYCRRWDGADINETSCEMMANDLMVHLISQGYNVAEVCVSEDGENGAVIKREV